MQSGFPINVSLTSEVFLTLDAGIWRNPSFSQRLIRKNLTSLLPNGGHALQAVFNNFEQ
jgi:hypothetical protein